LRRIPEEKGGEKGGRGGKRKTHGDRNPHVTLVIAGPEIKKKGVGDKEVPGGGSSKYPKSRPKGEKK